MHTPFQLQSQEIPVPTRQHSLRREEVGFWRLDPRSRDTNTAKCHHDQQVLC